MQRDLGETVDKALIAKDVLKRLGANVVIPRIIIKGKKVYGVGLKDGKVYVVFPEGMEDEIKKIFKKEVVVVESNT
ncbi:hypothetical protein IPA_02425 [Ignicoccus pacificus DSM 13166]|uniref:Uncharacterized protein n=1 Tax=Ignicoccus pacificus DSM 13166 TaxID=940294 RepID=A0A977KAP6_9CREN|nr:hypothetical protein IPA_02425 [Ignicoccus pacificus DSM 13166]